MSAFLARQRIRMIWALFPHPHLQTLELAAWGRHVFLNLPGAFDDHGVAARQSNLSGSYLRRSAERRVDDRHRDPLVTVWSRLVSVLERDHCSRRCRRGYCRLSTVDSLHVTRYAVKLLW